MALTATPHGLHFPPTAWAGTLSAATIDAAGEKFAMIGRVYMEGRATGAKTLSTGNIQFCTAAVTFNNGGTTVDVGIQGVASGAGPLAQPDGTFSVKKTLTGGGGGLTSSAWTTVTMDTGTVNLSHGDLVAVVLDMTARGGGDTVGIAYRFPLLGNNYFPTTNIFLASAWQTSRTVGAGNVPIAVITFNDGTKATLDSSWPAKSATTETFTDSTNPDERGMIFQVPWDCKIDGFWMYGGTTDAGSDFSLKLYSDPTGTPSAVSGGTIAVLAEQLGAPAADGMMFFNLATEISLTRNTDYALMLRASGTSNARLFAATLGDAGHRVFWPGGTTIAKGSRQNDTGAFTAESPAITMYSMGVRISQVHDTSSGSGGATQKVYGG